MNHIIDCLKTPNRKNHTLYLQFGKWARIEASRQENWPVRYTSPGHIIRNTKINNQTITILQSRKNENVGGINN